MLKTLAWVAVLVACNRSGAPGRDWSSVALDDTVESSVRNANFEIVRVDYMSHKGDTYLGCSAFQMRRGGVPNPQTTMEWLERLCKSLIIK